MALIDGLNDELEKRRPPQAWVLEYLPRVDSQGLAKLAGIVIDCRDPAALAGFWAELLGIDQVEPLGDPVHYVLIETDEPGRPYISFQRVPEPKTQKTRIHLDLRVEDLEDVTATVERLGGSRGTDIHEYGYSWRTMADPEGNEFCLIYVVGDTAG